MSIKNILFDLDGTLLPMVQDEFVRFYMPLLAKAYISAGIKVEPKSFISSVWKGYEAMVKNDGSRTNREAFWSFMEESLPTSIEESEATSTRRFRRPARRLLPMRRSKKQRIGGSAHFLPRTRCSRAVRP